MPKPKLNPSLPKPNPVRACGARGELPELPGENEPTAAKAEIDGLDGPKRDGGIVAQAAAYLTRYIVMPPLTPTVAAAWVVAAHLSDVWDRFPHLAVTSPEKRCGKTKFLLLLETLLPNPENTANISPAAIWRLIEKVKPTLLLDEAQSISRLASESSEVARELLNASIDRNAKVIRCVGKDHEPKGFPVYCPKVVSMIGRLDNVLADRCLLIELNRKTDADTVERIRERRVREEGRELSERIVEWAEANRERVSEVYDGLEPFDIENDRMAELLLPLQAILSVVDLQLLSDLELYAKGIEERDREAEMMTPGVLLLSAFRELFRGYSDAAFVSTDNAIKYLVKRTEEPWGLFARGKPINAEALAKLLKPFGIRSERNTKQTARGFHAGRFQDAWARYLTTLSETPSHPSHPSHPTVGKSTGKEVGG